jgi:hypothetical protein
MGKRIIAAIAALVLGFGGVLVGAAPAQAAPAKCNISGAPWINATDGSPTSWGRMRYCIVYQSTGDSQGWYPLFQVQDTLTDSYQVHLEFQDIFSGFDSVYHATGNGAGCEYVQSAGLVVESCWGPDTWSYYGGQDLYVRLVRGRACCPHQLVGLWESGWVLVINS